MSSNAVRPGNREKGWNDPPEFLHTENRSLLNQSGTGAKKTVLNQRVAHTFDGLNPNGASAPLAQSSSEPPKISSLKPRTESVTSNSSVNENSDTLCSISIDDIERILTVNVQTLRENQLNAKTCDDILKRVNTLVNNWPKLNDKVKLKMSDLAQYLDKCELDQADSIHVHLMLDFPSEVSQWMVGIKKLIHELKSMQTASSTGEQTTATTN